MPKIYHYTSIDTLALILKSKKFKFNRLDQVDDVEESCYGSGKLNTMIGQYAFVSCWTSDSEENLALWSMYTKYKGVRMGFDEDFFVRNIGGIPNSYFTIPDEVEDSESVLLQNEIKLYPVQYVDNLEEEVKNIVTIKDKERVSIQFDKVGLYKRKHWEMQKECRFRIVVVPANNKKETIKFGKGDPLFYIMEALIKSKADSIVGMIKNTPIKTKALFIPFNEEKINSMEIMLGPNTTEGEKEIVRKLLQEYPGVKPKNSRFDGRIRNKI